MIETFWRPLHCQLGAEELLELGRPLPMYRYAHTPFLAGRREAPRASVPARNLFQPGMGQGAAPMTAPASQGDQTLKKVLIIGIPIVVVAGIFALS